MRHVPPDFYLFFHEKLGPFFFCYYFVLFLADCVRLWKWDDDGSVFVVQHFPGGKFFVYFAEVDRAVILEASRFYPRKTFHFLIFWTDDDDNWGRVQKIKLTIKKGEKISLACGRQRDTQDTHFLLVMITTRQEVGRRVSCRVTRCHPFPPPSSSCCLFFLFLFWSHFSVRRRENSPNSNAIFWREMWEICAVASIP